MNKKDETMIFAISVTLMLYVNRIYRMASVNDEDVMTFVKKRMLLIHCYVLKC
jgi:hypothetical protein